MQLSRVIFHTCFFPNILLFLRGIKSKKTVNIVCYCSFSKQLLWSSLSANAQHSSSLYMASSCPPVPVQPFNHVLSPTGFPSVAIWRNTCNHQHVVFSAPLKKKMRLCFACLLFRGAALCSFLLHILSDVWGYLAIFKSSFIISHSGNQQCRWVYISVW